MAEQIYPLRVRPAALCADSFSRQRFDGRVSQKVKLSLDWFPFLCLSVFPFLCLSVPFSVSVGMGKVPMAGLSQGEDANTLDWVCVSGTECFGQSGM